MGQVICPFMWSINYFRLCTINQVDCQDWLKWPHHYHTDHKRLIIPTDYHQTVTGEHLFPPQSHYGPFRSFVFLHLCSHFWYMCRRAARVQWTQLHGLQPWIINSLSSSWADHSNHSNHSSECWRWSASPNTSGLPKCRVDASMSHHISHFLCLISS